MPHNPEVVGSSPASATIKNTGFRKKSGVFLTFRPEMEGLKPSIGVSLGLCATCTKEKTELFWCFLLDREVISLYREKFGN